jgi:hypothetical protein
VTLGQNYKPVPRNNADSEKAVSMWLRNRETGRMGRLSFPDLSGEAFRSQWTQRQMASTYDGSLRDAAGGILFVHPKIDKPHRIDLVNAVLDDIGGDGDKPTPKRKTRSWEIDRAPTQVQLVEILQFIEGRDYFQSPFRLAIVVSAWESHYPE